MDGKGRIAIVALVPILFFLVMAGGFFGFLLFLLSL